MTDAIQVVTTCASRDEAEGLAARLVELRLAACVQVAGPIQSYFRWQGQIDTSQEWLCLIKSRQEVYPRLEAAIQELHGYDVPEILAWPVSAGSQAYLQWLATAVS
jgi:periplasmic divalent cation tolerance protein